MNKIILLSALLMLLSCEIKRMDFVEGVIVTDIEHVSTAYPCQCWYYTAIQVGKTRSSFIDSCGKFNIGDTLKISKR